MVWRVEVLDKEGVFNAAAEGLKTEVRDLGWGSVQDIRIRSVYFLIGDLSLDEARRIAEDLLIDKVIQTYHVYAQNDPVPVPDGYKALQILHKPGVMDPVEDSTLKGIRDLAITSCEAVRTAKKFLFKTDLSRDALLKAAEKLLYNKLIQFVLPEEEHHLHDFSHLPDYVFVRRQIDLLSADAKRLLRLSREGQLYLNLDEMRCIQGYFKKLKREPTDIELETLAQTWSEHCVHKTFRGNVAYKEKRSKGAGGRRLKKIKSGLIKNLLKSTIMKVTKELKKPYCVSVFQDNSGIIKFDEKYNICFKVETHNHPSALEPYGGANTGIGGVIRDPLGTGLGAQPILNTDVFCFGPLDYPSSRLPQGALHPRRVMKGVVSGVRDYGNRMGIPTANGAVLFDERYVGNPLVYCGTVGILPKDKSFKKVQKGDVVVVVGGRTGRDGIHGATFSSGELTHESESVSSGAVQIGNAITEKKVLDVLLKVRDAGLYDAITDCGAGGLSSAVGEMGAELGARVHLDRVPLKYHGLSYTEIWISEAQERMVLAVKKSKAAALLEAFAKEDVEATVIGEFTGTKKLELFYGAHPVGVLDMDFLHEGVPRITKEAVWVAPVVKTKRPALAKDLTPTLLKLLSMPNIASKEWVIRQYDHEVQAGTVIKPFVGVANDGPSDACVVKPRFDSLKGFAVGCGINYKYGDHDPYWMAAGAIDEALRNVVAVGASLDQAAVLDNFCWGNPDKPDRLGGLVRAAYGCYDAAKAYGVPFISGKDSFYNEFAHGKKTIAIPGTLLISAIAVMDDVSRAVTMDLKKSGHLLYIVGETRPELGGSHYFDLMRLGICGAVPELDFKKAKAGMVRLGSAVKAGLVRSIHDCSEGGLGVAAAEMCFAANLGANIFCADVPYRGRDQREDFILFAESHARFLVEVDRRDQKAFEKKMKGTSVGLIGCVTDEPVFKVFGLKGRVCLEAAVGHLKEAWQAPLRQP